MGVLSKVMPLNSHMACPHNWNVSFILRKGSQYKDEMNFDEFQSCNAPGGQMQLFIIERQIIAETAILEAFL